MNGSYGVTEQQKLLLGCSHAHVPHPGMHVRLADRYQEAQDSHVAVLAQSDQTLADMRQQVHESKQRNLALQADLERAVAQATELQQRIMDKQNEVREDSVDISESCDEIER
jgi:hypothetical protein